MLRTGLLLLASEPICDKDGRPTIAFQKKWQAQLEYISGVEDQVIALADAVDTLSTDVAAMLADYVQKGQTPGWGTASGTGSRATFATSTVDVEQLAQRVKQLIDDLRLIEVLS